jgi:hypothetical protein
MQVFSISLREEGCGISVSARRHRKVGRGESGGRSHTAQAFRSTAPCGHSQPVTCNIATGPWPFRCQLGTISSAREDDGFVCRYPLEVLRRFILIAASRLCNSSGASYTVQQTIRGRGNHAGISKDFRTSSLTEPPRSDPISYNKLILYVNVEPIVHPFSKRKAGLVQCS